MQSISLQLCAFLGFSVAGLSAHAAHPLVTDDTGTQGSGHWQLEANTDGSQVKTVAGTSRSQVANATLTYGAADTLDVAVNLPYLYNRPAGESSVKGVGDATVQAKWRFYDRDGWTLGLKPAVTVSTGNAEKGLGAGRSTASLNLLSQYQKAQWTWLGNAGLTYNDNKTGNRKQLWNASTAVLYAVTEPLQLVGDVGISRNPDATAGASKTLSYALAGAIYHMGKDVDLDVGYRRSLQTGPVTHTVGAGMTVRW